MIQKQLLNIVSHRQLAYETYEIVLESEQATTLRPGQFVHIALPHHVLRRPISVANVNQQEQTFTIIFKVFGDGTKRLTKFQAGDQLDVILPCGGYYPIDELDIKRALIVGGGVGVPPLYYLAKTLKEKGVEISSILGFQGKEHVFYEDKFKQLGDTYIATNDGTYGHQGFVTDVIKKITPAFDYYFTCGPTPMLQAVTNLLENSKGYISLEERMGCGVGTCYACVVPRRSNPDKSLKICKDGPVFAANEVILG